MSLAALLRVSTSTSACEDRNRKLLKKTLERGARHAVGRPGDEEKVLVAVHHWRADRSRVSRTPLARAAAAVGRRQAH